MGNSRGYRRNLKVFALAYEEFDGLEIKAKSVPVGKLLTVLKLADSIKDAPDQEDIEELFGWFASRIISWTYLDEEGEPLPPTLETLLDDDFDFVLKLIMGWVKALTTALVPTMPDSGSTQSPDPVENSIPMTTTPAAETAPAGT